MSTPKRVLVKWIDSSGSGSSWTSLEAARDFDLCYMQTIGHLVKENDTFIVLAASYDEENESVNHLTAIPRACIQGEIQELAPELGAAEAGAE